VECNSPSFKTFYSVVYEFSREFCQEFMVADIAFDFSDDLCLVFKKEKQ